MDMRIRFKGGRVFKNRIIKTTEEVVMVAPPSNGEYYSIEELSAFIGGGWPEILRISSSACMVVDDNFHAKALPFNTLATWIYAPASVRCGGLSTCPIRGDVALIAQEQIQ
jgi:hypothetical protein